MKGLPFRQVHLDFHNSEKISDIAINFSKGQFQSMIKLGHVNSVTVFAKCHHGWAYHYTKNNEMHPHLKFDLLKEMIDACHEIGVKTPVYISAGLDEKTARRHPEWLFRNKDESTTWACNFMEPGYHELCLNSPYLNYLIEQIKEIVSNYDCYGLFLDIVGERECYCQNCINTLLNEGKDPRDKNAVIELGKRTFANYTTKVRQAVDEIKPGLPIFHNNGDIERGRKDLENINSHLELESLPTGRWGYDYFPISARYLQNSHKDILGMTGKFHTTWGEFGGYKHPNALKYETSICLALGTRCSIGDQMHPEGFLDESTYTLMGEAFSEVEKKESWCYNSKNIANVGLISSVAAYSTNNECCINNTDIMNTVDIGAFRILTEGKYLFDIIDFGCDFSKYKVIILPDIIRLDSKMTSLLTEYIENGGKVLVTGESALWTDKDKFSIDLGVNFIGENKYNPAYLRPTFDLKNLKSSSFVFYNKGFIVEKVHGDTLGYIQNPYFNRDLFHFSSHFHTVYKPEDISPSIIKTPNSIYISWNLFAEYANQGSITTKEIICHCLDELLTENTVKTNLPAQGTITLRQQESKNRYIAHILYGAPVSRGSGIKIIEDLLPIYDCTVTINIPSSIKNIYLAPQMIDIPFNQEGNNITFTLEKFICHQMVILDY